MAHVENRKLVDRFEQFYRTYYREEIGDLAQNYPGEQRSLHVDWGDLYQFDPDVAEDYLAQPDQLREYAEEALRLYDLPVDVSLGQAHVRIRGLSEWTEIRDIRSRDVNSLVAVQGIVRKATDVRPKIEEAAFECQRCGTLSYIPQSGGFQEPHECQGCERQGPFQINYDQSTFVDAQKIRVQESPEGLRGGETPQSIDVDIEDDVTGEVTPGDHVTVTGVLRIEQQSSNNEKSRMFDVYMDGHSVVLEDEEFENMEITEADKQAIVELANTDDIYSKMVESTAPTIWGYDQIKLAMVLQLFSGVTKHLPDESRIRGDLHMLLIGDPGTGKSQLLQYIRHIAPRSVYTSGKGSSSAGLCVTGDTLIHTEDGLRQIRDVAKAYHPESVDENTPAEYETGVYSFVRSDGELDLRETSHVWRMPEKPCRRIKTSHGKELEASVNTPVLTCGENGIEWKQISDVEAGKYVAVPRYGEIERTSRDVMDHLELTNEKVKLDDESITHLRNWLVETFGTLREAAAELDLPEDFIYDSLSNRHVPLDRLDVILDAIDAKREDVRFDRVMLRHGESITLPDEFDEDLMYLLGLVFGDGDIAISRRGENRGLVRISNGDEGLLRRAVRIFERKFDKQVEIEYQDDKVPCIRVNSATIARLFANAGMTTPKDDLALDEHLTTAEHADAFLRGLMDADGSVSCRTNGGSSIHFSTISEELARQVQAMLETYGVRARVRERDRRGAYELDSETTIETKCLQYHVELYGADIDRYANAIGFESPEKRAALKRITGDAERREETIPVGKALAGVDGTAGQYYMNLNRGDNPGRGRARAMIDDLDLGDTEPIVEEAVDADLRWDEVVAAVDTGKKEVFDLTVPGTHNFVANGVVTHNTAAAIRDDFGDGQQWTLEAGALVLADKGIAAVDELDKMRCVTGDTLVQMADSSSVPIEELAERASRVGKIENRERGRTIRGCNARVRTMNDDERIVDRDVTAVHEYEAPDTLVEVTLESGSELIATSDHPFFVDEDGERIEKPAINVTVGDEVYVPQSTKGIRADGGAHIRTTTSSGSKPEDRTIEQCRVCDVSLVDGEGKHVYDLTVEGTHNFVANGMIVHNSEDRSAMHEALEQQSISISKAGINATLKSRCSLLGAANPKYGRFDQYEPIGEQIELEPALISRFDLIFTVTDQPDEEEDTRLAEHILNTNYAGELNTKRTELASPDVSEEDLAAVQSDVEPEIDPELLRKYIAYAKRNVFPSMTEEAREAIQEFYVDLRLEGADEDAPVPVTARKLEALVRLAEASARVRLSDTVEREDADRVIDIVRACLRDIGVDPETGNFDADVIETGTSKTQRDRIKNLQALVEDIAGDYEDGAPVEEVIERADEIGMEEAKVEHEIEQLKRKGELYEPAQGYLRTT